jgi:hyperosmotically inducible protein
VIARTTHPVSIILTSACCALALSLAACDRTVSPAISHAGAAPIPEAQAGADKRASEGTAQIDPDTQLAAKVKSALADDPELKMLPIDVRAANGVVTLFGTTHDTRLLEKALQAASRVEGVKSVGNSLQIVLGS